MMNEEIAAMAAHEINRIACSAIGDGSQPWRRAPQWQIIFNSLLRGKVFVRQETMLESGGLAQRGESVEPVGDTI